ncbi:MAG: MBOAT family protein, partial [Clostridiales bacterium]|nr:MBOAT family protein [Clostridiales bacterium]
MLFSSLTFVVWFLPVVIVVHRLLPFRFKNLFLLCASVFFYAWGEIAYVPLVLVSMGLNYGFGLMVARDTPGRRRLWLVLSVLFNFGALVYFKYAGFFLNVVGLGAFDPGVTMPLGISFYTFQTQGYVVDVYRGKVPPEKNIISLMTFILLFPQLIAGPIVLYTDVRNELKVRTLPAEAMDRGMAQFIIGLSSKVLLANPLG